MGHTAQSAMALAPARRRDWTVPAGVLVGFVAALIPTLYFCLRMRGGMPMPGGWEMSMAWMPMGRWASATLMFAAMWLAMMVAMMLPSTLPVLQLFRRVCVFRQERNTGWLCVAVAAGYFAVWLAFGMFAYAIGVGVTQAAMKWDAVSHAIPFLGAAALVLAGLYQLTPLKQNCLQHCRDPLLLMSHHRGQGWRGAVHLGGSHGVYCVCCCWALMLVQLVQGVMSVRVMAVIAAIIAMEKLLSRGYWLSRVFGGVFLGAGIYTFLEAAGRFTY